MHLKHGYKLNAYDVWKIYIIGYLELATERFKFSTC